MVELNHKMASLDEKVKVLAKVAEILPNYLSDILSGNKDLPALATLKICYEYGIPITDTSIESIPYQHFYKRPTVNYFWNNLEEIFEYDIPALRQYLIKEGFNCKQMMMQRGRNDSPKFCDVLKLSQKLDISAFHLVSNTLDVELVRRIVNPYFGRPSHIPSKFTISSGSKMRNFKSLVSFTKKEFEQEIILEALQSFQIPSRSISHLDKNINLKLFSDFHQLLRRLGANDFLFIKLGANCINSKSIKKHFNQLVQPLSVREAYCSIMTQLAPNLDTNVKYELMAIDEKSCVLKTTPNPNRVKELGTEVMYSKEINLYRFGHVIKMPHYFGFHSGDLKKSWLEFDDMTGISINHIVY